MQVRVAGGTSEQVRQGQYVRRRKGTRGGKERVQTPPWDRGWQKGLLIYAVAGSSRHPKLVLVAASINLAAGSLPLTSSPATSTRIAVNSSASAGSS